MKTNRYKLGNVIYCLDTSYTKINLIEINKYKVVAIEESDLGIKYIVKRIFSDGGLSTNNVGYYENCVGSTPQNAMENYTAFILEKFAEWTINNNNGDWEK